MKDHWSLGFFSSTTKKDWLTQIHLPTKNGAGKGILCAIFVCSMLDIAQIIRKEKIAFLDQNSVIPCFSPKNEKNQAQDKYEDITGNIDNYTFMAFTQQEGSKNRQDSIYPVVHQLVHNYVENHASSLLLDVGCGVGRSLQELSDSIKGLQLIGFDYSVNMLERAKKILLEDGQLEIDLSASGFDKFILDCKKRENVQLIQGDVSDIPFKKNIFDIVLNTFLIDRVPNIDLAMKQMIDVLKPGGLFVLSSPLNFQRKEDWIYKEAADIAKILLQIGLSEVQVKDNLVHREIIDGRGNAKVWNTALIWGHKK